MRYIIWLARLFVFLLVLMFALNNTKLVDVQFYGEHLVTDVPLIIVMLAAFVLGTGFALLLAAPGMLRRCREIRRLKRELRRLQDRAEQTMDTSAPISATTGLVPTLTSRLGDVVR